MRSRLLSPALAALGLLLLAGCASSPAAAPAETRTPPAATQTAPAPTGGATGACSYEQSAGAAARDTTAPPADPTVSGSVAATLQTSAGDIAIALDADRTPCTVGSFVSLAEQGYYDDTSCHRLITSSISILQCGDPTATGTGGPGYSYADELDGSETYPAGTVAMANAGPDTNGSQFFLVFEDTMLDPDYTVFGQISPEGLEVVRAIAAVGADANDAPLTPVDITSVTIG